MSYLDNYTQNFLLTLIPSYTFPHFNCPLNCMFQPSLQILNVSGNNLDSVRDLQPCRCLTQLLANDNHLGDMKEMAQILGQSRLLWRLELMGNPLCHKSKYRDRIIILAPCLGMSEATHGREIREISNVGSGFL